MSREYLDNRHTGLKEKRKPAKEKRLLDTQYRSGAAAVLPHEAHATTAGRSRPGKNRPCAVVAWGSRRRTRSAYGAHYNLDPRSLSSFRLRKLRRKESRHRVPATKEMSGPEMCLRHRPPSKTPPPATPPRRDPESLLDCADLPESFPAHAVPNLPTNQKTNQTDQRRESREDQIRQNPIQKRKEQTHQTPNSNTPETKHRRSKNKTPFRH